MKRILEYLILSATTGDQLAVLVNGGIKKKQQPLGDPFVVASTPGAIIWRQTMVIYGADF